MDDLDLCSQNYLLIEDGDTTQGPHVWHPCQTQVTVPTSSDDSSWSVQIVIEVYCVHCLLVRPLNRPV